MPSQSKSTSVFHALGSYADRIKHEQRNGKASGSTSAASSSLPSPAPSARNDAADDDDGSWETVAAPKHKKRNDRTERASAGDRTEDKGRSNSRNWRDRGDDKEKDKAATSANAEKDGKDSKAKDDSGKRDSKVSKGSKDSKDSEDGNDTKDEDVTPRTSAISSPTKSAWIATGASLPTAEATSSSRPDTQPLTEGTANGSSSGSVSGGHSHKPSGDKALTKADEEDNWRRKEPVVAAPAAAPVPAPAPPPAPVVPAKAAPPPSVNAWDLRKKKQPSATSTSKEPTPAQAAKAPAAAESHSEASGKPKKAKKKAADNHAGDSHWPDVSTSAASESKGKHVKQGSESTADESAQGGKKPKWTKMSASELQEAADKAAETSRRQAKQKQRARGEGSDEPVKPKGVHKQRQAEKAAAQRPPRATRSGSQASERPSMVTTNGRLESATASEASDANGELPPNGTLSVPLSRQGSNHAKRSPHAASTPLSPESAQHFANLPRAPRGRDRDGRGAYRGRGGYRSASNTPMNRMYDLSPVGTNASLYGAGYVGYGYYPMPPAGVVIASTSSGYDAVAGTFNGVPVYPRGGMPPPPLPVTHVANLDPLRYWVLGQVEYYFSMQNLAMDFFLRQQMDAEGWIDIGMIASFNRIKTLTADMSIVKEVMGMSSLLESKGDKVRLSGGEAQRWVLPDAKPSNLAPGAIASPKKSSGESAEVSHGIPANVNFTDDGDGSALGIEDMATPTSPVPKFDVENALLRSGGTASARASEAAETLSVATESVKDTTEESEAGETGDK